MKKLVSDEAVKLVRHIDDRGAAVTATGKTLIFTVAGKEQKFPAKLSEIDAENLESEFATWGGHQLWFGKLVILAKSRFEAWKVHMDIKLATLDRAVRALFQKEGIKPTEKMIDMRIKSLPDYRKWMEELMKRREDWELAQLAKDALEKKKDLILQGHVKMRVAEMTTMLRVADARSEASSKRNRKLRRDDDD